MTHARCLVLAALTCLGLSLTSRALDVAVDCAKPLPTLPRAVQGLNCGPVEQQGMIDLTAYYKTIRPPFVRLHDCNWPNPDVVDLHAVFPNFAADADDPASYDFLRTDDYLKQVIATGAGVIYRLGESIEHGKDKRRCKPPADVDKWAKVCANVVAHYNDGWANGFKLNVKYWEVWNEPENRPACWTGNDEDYYRLYVATARAIKGRFPGVKVGGPATGSPGTLMRDGSFKPTPFVKGFLERCKAEGAALDFFSWHHYAAGPAEFSPRAWGVRAYLDAAGFDKAESHLTEWNWLPGADWGPVLPSGQGAKRQRFFDRMGGAEAAGFVASAMIALQDDPVDVSCFYAGNTIGFGLFNVSGTPKRSVFAVRAVADTVALPTRVAASGGGNGADRVAVLATAGKDEARVLLANFKAADGEVSLALNNWPWEGDAKVEETRVDEKEEGRVVGTRRVGRGEAVKVSVKAPGICLLTFRKG